MTVSSLFLLKGELEISIQGKRVLLYKFEITGYEWASEKKLIN